VGKEKESPKPSRGPTAHRQSPQYSRSSKGVPKNTREDREQGGEGTVHAGERGEGRRHPSVGGAEVLSREQKALSKRTTPEEGKKRVKKGL